jgi:hypothetical protein
MIDCTSVNKLCVRNRDLHSYEERVASFYLFGCKYLRDNRYLCEYVPTAATHSWALTDVHGLPGML